MSDVMAVRHPDGRKCANILLHQPQRQQMAPELARQKWLAPTSDSPVYRAMQWLQDHLGETYQLAALSHAAATSERTLLRHFKNVVGMTPLDYLHGLRVERAKMLLEVSLHNMHTIATACGYVNATSFRRLFHSVTGVNPSEYRARFRLRSHRPRWKVEMTGKDNT
jgi:transcriptional regulator GlxA family with amidase domain